MRLIRYNKTRENFSASFRPMRLMLQCWTLDHDPALCARSSAPPLGLQQHDGDKRHLYKEDGQ
jgi:hypothetical protein